LISPIGPAGYGCTHNPTSVPNARHPQYQRLSVTGGAGSSGYDTSRSIPPPCGSNTAATGQNSSTAHNRPPTGARNPGRKNRCTPGNSAYRLTKVRQAVGENARLGPLVFFESRTPTALASNATSMQPPLAPVPL
jgi:hypothetical protein